MITDQENNEPWLKVVGLLLPIILSTLVMAAHFLRSSSMGLVLLSLALPWLLLVRRTWAVRVVQVALGLGSLGWVLTAWVLLRDRQLLGQPSQRMVIILATVALFTALSGLMLEFPALRRSFRRN